MDEPLDEQYINWLYSQVASVRLKNPARTFWSLFRQLYNKEFIWLVPNDDNRVEDGRNLRLEFVEQTQGDPEPEWMGLGCSVLEMLIGLSRRLSFVADGESRDWFWELLTNLQIDVYNDSYYKRCDYQIVDDALDRLIFRNYNFDGRGGLFPLTYPDQDQTKVELWYQMSMFLLERD